MSRYKGEKAFSTLEERDREWLIELRDKSWADIRALFTSSRGNGLARNWAKWHVCDPQSGDNARDNGYTCVEIDCKAGATYEDCRFIRRDSGPGTATWFFAKHQQGARPGDFNYWKISGTPSTWA